MLHTFLQIHYIDSYILNCRHAGWMDKDNRCTWTLYVQLKTAAEEVNTVYMDKLLDTRKMQGKRQDGEKKGGGSEKRARGLSLLWQAKTAALLKLQCSATMLWGVCLCLHTSLCMWWEQGAVQGRDREGESEGIDRQEDFVISLPGEMLTVRWMRWLCRFFRSSLPANHRLTVILFLPSVATPDQKWLKLFSPVCIKQIVAFIYLLVLVTIKHDFLAYLITLCSGCINFLLGVARLGHTLREGWYIC